MEGFNKAADIFDIDIPPCQVNKRDACMLRPFPDTLLGNGRLISSVSIQGCRRQPIAEYQALSQMSFTKLLILTAKLIYVYLDLRFILVRITNEPIHI